MNKIGSVLEYPVYRNTPFRRGDPVINRDLGNGVVVGFSSISGEPHVFFYSRQEVICVGAKTLERS